MSRRSPFRSRSSRRAFAAIALVLFALTIVYPPVRVATWLDFNPIVEIVGLLTFIAIPSTGAFARFIFRVRIPQLQSRFVVTWLGLLFALFPVVVVCEVGGLVLRLESPTQGYLALLMWFLVSVYSLVNAQLLITRKVRVPSAPEVHGKVAVQVSDVHVGSRRSAFLKRIVTRIQAQQPDLVFITGDLVDASDITIKELAELAPIADKTFYVTGNHEHYEDCDAIVDSLEALGVTVLRDRAVDCPPFQIVGIEDSESADKVSATLDAIEPDSRRCRLVLHHRPQGIEAANAWGAHLMLSGHTHAGQIFPFNLIVNRFFKFTRGTHFLNERERMKLHVSTGTGTWGPLLRLGSHNEITRIDFVPQPS